jgi:hypothetical protein
VPLAALAAQGWAGHPAAALSGVRARARLVADWA